MDSAAFMHLTLICLGAYLMPFISKRLMLPTAVGELFFGMVIGTFLLDSAIATDNEAVTLLSSLGFLLLMYIAGLELDIDRILALKRREVWAFGLYTILLVSGAYCAVKILDLPLFFTLIIMTTAIGLLFSVMKDIDLVKTALGQILILIGAVGEVLTLAGITIVSVASLPGTPEVKIKHIAGILIFLLIVIMALKFLNLFLWWFPEAKEIIMTVGNPSEIGIRANLCNMFVFVTIAAFVDLEPILGAFLGGMLFARIFPDREQVLERLSSFGYGFLVPLFFIEVGTRFKFADLLNAEVLKGAILISIAILIVRFVAATPMLLLNLPRKQLLYIPFSQSSALTLLVAGATLGANLQLINRTQTSMIILTAILTAIIYPWIIKLLVRAIPVNR
jgi:Kef-type K+ transport system membrane component KefB